MSNVIDVEVIEELPLDKQIENALVKENVTDRVIDELKEKFGGMKLKSIDDKESFLEIKDSRKQVRAVGILAEKICKKGRENAVAIQKLWLKKEDEVLKRIAEVQDPLDAEIKKYEDEVKRLDEEKKKKQEEEMMGRQTQLARLGTQFISGNWVLNHISYEWSNIQEVDKEMFEGVILPKYKAQYEKNEAERVEAEKKREQEMAELKRQQEEMEKQRLEFEQQKSEMQRQKDELDREKRVEEERKNNEYQQKMRDRINKRYDQLYALGLTFNAQYMAYTYKDINVDNNTEINLFKDEEWQALIDKITPVIAQRKEEAKKQGEERIIKEKEQAVAEGIEKERLRVEVERVENERKELEEKARQEEAAAKADDKTKWEMFVLQVNKITVPAMKSPTYKNKSNNATSLIKQIMEL